MNDNELDRLLDQAARHWRQPPEPPADEMWQVISQAQESRRWQPGWGMVGIAAAAALVVGVLGGQFMARPSAPPPVALTRPPVAMPANPVATIATADPDQHAVGELLGQTTVLLAALPTDSGTRALDPQITRESIRLLTTTRLLLDSRVGSDRRMRNLLEDLELVLAQVARLEPRPHHDEMQIIQTTLHEHDLVPRLRSAVADLSVDDF